METFSNKKKNKQLEMPFGTAQNILKKAIMFQLIQKLNIDYCYQCGNKIESVNDLSIEHKVPWLDSDNPKELFFDLNNIAFSHLRCNTGAVRKEYLSEVGRKLAKSNIIPCPKGYARCYKCKETKLISEFNKDKNKKRGIQSYCRKCQNKKESI
jgi:hypothetical protein